MYLCAQSVTKRIEFNWKKKQLTTTSLKLDAKDERDDDDDDERLVASMASPSYASFLFSFFFVTRFEKQTQRDLHRRREEEEE